MAKKLTQKEFIDQVIRLQGDKYNFEKTNYINTRTPIVVTCKKHQYDFKVKAEVLTHNKFSDKKREFVVGSCPKCQEEYIQNIKLNFIEKLRIAHNYEYEYDVDNYINELIPFNAICKLHGNFLIFAKNHITGTNKCPVCYPSNKRFEKWIDNKRYYICEIHGDVLIGKKRELSKGCPKCNIEKQNKINLEKHQNNIINKFGEKYNITFNDNTITFVCKKHLTSETVIDKEYSRNHFCNDCRQDVIDINMNQLKEIHNINVEKIKNILLNKFKNKYEFIEIIKDTDGYKVKLYNVLLEKERIVHMSSILHDGQLSNNINNVLRNLVSYEEAKAKVRALGIKSFREYKKWHVRTKQTTMPSNPHRAYKKEWISHYEFFGTDKTERMSWGESRINSYLLRKNIEFVWQKRFKDCRDKNTLPFDFYLPKYNLIVESDGEQHYNNI